MISNTPEQLALSWKLKENSLASIRTSHFVPVYLALFAIPFGVACSDGRAESTAASARGSSSVQSDLAKAHEDYRQQKKKDLDAIDKNIADLEAKDKAAGAKTNADRDRVLAALKAERNAFSEELSGIGSAGAADWDSTKSRADKDWAELKAATDKAASAAISAVYKPAEMTCEDFVALTDVQKPKVMYWAEGFNKNGKPTDATVDVAETDKLVPAIVTECMKTPKATLSGTLKAHPVGDKAVASAPKPTTMTCKEFVTLEDVTQPRLVYWAEGFNKAGKPTDSAVDIDETDRLVPVVVKECKETPKLTFWEKIKKYF